MLGFRSIGRVVNFSAASSNLRVVFSVRLINVIAVSLMLGIVTQAAAQVQFENTTEALGGPFHTGESWGASWGHMDDDVYPDLYVSNHSMLNSLLLNNGGTGFTERVHEADLEGVWTSEPASDIHGGAWADFDNDGDQDLFVTRSSQGARVHVFENNGQGLFLEKGGNFRIGGVGGGRMPLFFDYTNDGWLDVMIAGNRGNRVFKWDGSKYKEETFPAGISGGCKGGHSGAVSDFFGDGLIHICTSAHGIPETAFDMTTIPFTDVLDKIDRIGTTPDSVLADFDNDLRIDAFGLRGLVRPSGVQKISDNRIEAWLAVGGTVDYISSFTFKANGPITVDIAARTAEKPEYIYIGDSGYHPDSVPVTLDPTDSNNWGRLSNLNRFGAFIEYDPVAEEWTITMSAGGNGAGEGVFFKVDGSGLTTPTVTGLTGADLPLKPRFLFNTGSRLELSSSRGIDKVQCGGIAAADFDNDMDVDLYLTCRSSTENLGNRLYLNDGSGNFSLASSSTGAEGLLGAGVDGGAGTAEMAVTADYDVDGFMDLFVTNGNRLRPRIDQDGYTAGGPDQFYRNLGGNGNHWLEIDLEGVTSNRDGFGTRVIVTAGGVQQLREQNGMYHRWSHDHKRLHFGLASNTSASIRIEWPDGSVDEHNGVPADRLYRATQNGALTDITPEVGALSMSINSDSVNSGEDARLTVSLSVPSSEEVTVDYQTVDGTAVSGLDYVEQSGSLAFAPNQTSKTITVPTIVDDVPEPAETFTVSLSNAVGAVIGNGTGTVIIRAPENDACGQPDYSAGIDKGFFVWRDCDNSDKWIVRATAGGGSTVTYESVFLSSKQMGSLDNYSFEGSDFAELSDSDKRLESQLKMVNAGQDGFEFSLSIDSELCLMLEDPAQIIYIGSERLPFTSPLNLVTLNSSCAEALTLNGLSVADVSVSEAAGSVEVMVTLEEGLAELVNVLYETVAISATADIDFTPVSGSIDFLPGETNKVVSIPILQDGDTEPLEQFRLVISSATNADIIDDDGIVSILDDEINVCGTPNYSRFDDAGLFLWQDCDDTGNTTGNWLMRATSGGGSAVTYSGLLSADLPITSVTPYSFEGIDSATLSNSDQDLDFLMKMKGSGEDGLQFSVPLGNACLSLDAPAGIQVIVGPDNSPVTPPFNIDTLGPC